LTLKRLHEALQDGETRKVIEDRTNIAHEKFDQFTKQYKKVESGPAGQGRKIEVKSGPQQPAKAAQNLPPLDSTQRFGTTNIRERGSQPLDDTRGLKQDVRNEAPPEWRSRVEGYKNRIARSKVTASRRAAQPKPTATP
jgi:hypothetical protein